MLPATHIELLLGIQNLDEDGDAVCWPAVAVRRVKRGPGCVTAWSRVGSTQVYWAHFASNLKHATTRAYPPTKTSALQCRSHLKAKTKRDPPPKNTPRGIAAGTLRYGTGYLEMPHLEVPSSMEGGYPNFFTQFTFRNR